MNFPDVKSFSAAAAMPDVQGTADHRNLPIDQVGVRAVRYPVLVKREDGSTTASVGEFSLSVALPADQKGTHMSRFIALLEQMNQQGLVLTAQGMHELLLEMLDRLGASAGRIQVDLPFFIMKAAPVSGVKSLMDYQLQWAAERGAQSEQGEQAEHAGQPKQPEQVTLQVKVPVKSLCPCSKEIADYGAHNQRSQVTVRLALPADSGLAPEAVIRAVEAQASCELWGLLKRPDEKYVTERAYDNPKFVEDLVRDVAQAMKGLPGVRALQIEAENFESIHNHSAWARITSD
jgi:GTP cyclohydrolase IB